MGWELVSRIAQIKGLHGEGEKQTPSIPPPILSGCTTYQGDLGKGTKRGKPLAPEGWHVCKNLVGNAQAKDAGIPDEFRAKSSPQ